MRRKIKVKRPLEPDGLYGSVRVSKFINYLMERGKKNAARKIVYGAFDEIKEKTKKPDPLEVFEEAMRNAGPSMELKGRRVGGANYQIPFEVSGPRRDTLAMRWIIEAARGKKGSPMSNRLAEELVLASKNEGEAIKKRDAVHRMAEANRAFAHFARSYKKK